MIKYLAVFLGLGIAANAVWGQSPQSVRPNHVFVEDKDWKVVDMSDLDVKEGSALDVEGTAKIQRKPKGKKLLPRLVIGATGKLEAEGAPGKVTRLMGTGANWAWILGHAKGDSRWKETWDHEAIQAQRQGYNLIRAGFDSLQTQDLLITDDLLDKADYTVATMGERGIYTFFTVGAYGIYLKNAWGPLQEGQRRDYTLRMYLGDEEVRRAWKYGAETFMSHVNAYTGLAWKDDPRIACIELFNEQEWGFFHAKSRFALQTQQEFDAKFRQWLKAKYETPATLAKAWEEPSITDFSQVIVPENFPRASRKVKDNDFILFCGELSHESAKWMRNTLRGTGYKGLVSQYNLSQWLVGQETRWSESQTTIANTYHNHPSDFDNPGSKCAQNSSVSNAGAYWRSIVSMRFADRPFIETEFNHPFWNQYQHEGGILFGAYSALQGLDGLMVHSGALFVSADRKPGMGIFTVGKSPTLRANQFLLFCLWRRGDVKPSPHRIDLQIPKTYLETDGNGGRTISMEQNKLALLTGFSIAFPWVKPAEGVGIPVAPDWTIATPNSAEFQSGGGGWAIGAGDSSSPSSFSLDTAMAYMKKIGILPAENASVPSEGIFQSDTGEITMRSRENLLKVATLRSEAVTLEAGKSERVERLEVLNTSVPALVATCAVDGKILARSKRIVLLYVTDTANTGMELSPDRTTLVRLGESPILMKVGKLEMKLKNSNAAKMSLYALGVDGSRREKMPLKSDGQVLSVNLDTSTLQKGMTPFFELVEE